MKGGIAREVSSSGFKCAVVALCGLRNREQALFSDGFAAGLTNPDIVAAESTFGGFQTYRALVCRPMDRLAN